MDDLKQRLRDADEKAKQLYGVDMPLIMEAADALDAKDAEIARLRAALQTTLDKWVDMANSGDCGFWDPEDEPHVIAARAALTDSSA